MSLYRSRGIVSGVCAALVGIVLAAGALGAEEATPAPAAARGAVGVGDGYQLPEFSAVDLTGNPQSLGRYKGSVLILHFWASWCPYCRGEVPKLLQIEKDFKAKGVRVLAVSSDEDLEKLKAFVAKEQLSYPVIADAQRAAPIFDQYGVSGIPVTFIVAKDGHAAFRLNGSSDIAGALQALLQ